MLTALNQQNAQRFSFDIYRIITLYIPTYFSPQGITIREKYQIIMHKINYPFLYINIIALNNQAVKCKDFS